MRLVRSLPAVLTLGALALGAPFLIAGCGGSSESTKETVKDMPLPPDQQKSFDAYYKKNSAKK